MNGHTLDKKLNLQVDLLSRLKQARPVPARSLRRLSVIVASVSSSGEMGSHSLGSLQLHSLNSESGLGVAEVSLSHCSAFVYLGKCRFIQRAANARMQACLLVTADSLTTAAINRKSFRMKVLKSACFI